MYPQRMSLFLHVVRFIILSYSVKFWTICIYLALLDQISLLVVLAQKSLIQLELAGGVERGQN